MGQIAVDDLITKVAKLLLDVDNIRWSREDLLEYLNEAQRQIVVAQPHNNGTTVVVATIEGSRQTLPDGGIMLLDVICNMGRAGNQPNRAIRVVSRKLLDALDPYWHYNNPGPLAHNVVYDEQDPRVFYVYPPSDSTQTIQLRYVGVPVDTALGQTITVNDEYEPALVEYMLYRACSKEAEFSPGPDRAASHYNAYQAALASKMGGEAANTPNQNLVPKVPGSIPGGQS